MNETPSTLRPKIWKHNFIFTVRPIVYTNRSRRRSSNWRNRPFSLGRLVVPLQTTWYSLKNCSFIHLKIIYSYTHDYLKIWKEKFSRESSHGLKWGNKPPSRKRSTKHLLKIASDQSGCTFYQLRLSEITASEIWHIFLKKPRTKLPWGKLSNLSAPTTI